MKLLAVDTSAVAASAALADENGIIGEFFTNSALTHSQTLMPMIDSLLKCTSTAFEEIDAFAVNSGPGSFTGVRIGVAAVKGLAFTGSKPCFSVSTLESMAYNAASCDNATVCALMDARCGQVYNALFDISGGSVKRLTPDRALALSDLKTELKKYDNKIILLGDGAKITECFLSGELANVSLAPANVLMQRASSTAMAAFAQLGMGESPLSCGELMPVYLRLPQAQRELNKKRGIKQ